MNPANYNIDISAEGVILMARSTQVMEASKSPAYQNYPVPPPQSEGVPLFEADVSSAPDDQLESDPNLASYVDFARSIAKGVAPEFQQEVFSRAMRAYYSRPLALQRSMKMADARREGGDVAKAAKSVYLDINKLPTLRGSKRRV